MRNEALLFALKQQRDCGGAASAARGAPFGSGINKRSHASGADSSPSGDRTSTRPTADVGVQMVHSQVFALDAIIQCKIADDERVQNATICSICGGTAEEALEGELTLSLGLGDQRIQHRAHSPESLGKGDGPAEAECEAACMQLSDMRRDLQQLHASLRGSMHKMTVSRDRHAREHQPPALLLEDSAAEIVEHTDGAGAAGVAEGPADDSGGNSLLHSCPKCLWQSVERSHSHTGVVKPTFASGCCNCGVHHSLLETTCHALLVDRRSTPSRSRRQVENPGTPQCCRSCRGS